MTRLLHARKLWNQELNPSKPMGFLRTLFDSSLRALSAQDEALYFLRALEGTEQDLQGLSEESVQQLQAFHSSYAEKEGDDQRRIKAAVDFRIVELFHAEAKYQASGKCVDNRFATLSSIEETHLLALKHLSKMQGDFLLRYADQLRYWLWEGQMALKDMPVLSEEEQQQVAEVLANNKGERGVVSEFLFEAKVPFNALLGCIKNPSLMNLLCTEKQRLSHFFNTAKEGVVPDYSFFFNLSAETHGRFLDGSYCLSVSDLTDFSENKGLSEKIKTWDLKEFKLRHRLGFTLTQYLDLRDVIHEIKNLKLSESVSSDQRYIAMKSIQEADLSDEQKAFAVRYYLGSEEYGLESVATILQAAKESSLVEFFSKESPFSTMKLVEISEYAKVVGYDRSSIAGTKGLLDKDVISKEVFFSKPFEKIQWCLRERENLIRYHSECDSDMRFDELLEYNVSDLNVWLSLNLRGLKASLKEINSLSLQFFEELRKDKPEYSQNNWRSALRATQFYSLSRQKRKVVQDNRAYLCHVPERMWAELYDTDHPERLGWCLKRVKYLKSVFHEVPEELTLVQFMDYSEGLRDILVFSRTPIVAYSAMTGRQKQRLSNHEVELLSAYAGQPVRDECERPFGLSLADLLNLPEARFKWALRRIKDPFSRSEACRGLLSNNLATYRDLFWENKKALVKSWCSSSESAYERYFSEAGRKEHRKEQFDLVGKFVWQTLKCAPLPFFSLVELGCAAGLFSLWAMGGLDWVSQWEVIFAWSGFGVTTAAGILFLVLTVLSMRQDSPLHEPYDDWKEMRSEFAFFKKVPLVHDPVEAPKNEVCV